MTTSQTQPSPIDALPGAEHFLAAPGNPEALRRAPEDSRERIEALLQVDPDDRLALLESPPWNFTTDHLRQVNGVFEKLLVVSHVWNRRDRGGEVCSWRPGC